MCLTWFRFWPKDCVEVGSGSGCLLGLASNFLVSPLDHKERFYSLRLSKIGLGCGSVNRTLDIQT